jgi:hypothetical protein
MYIRRYCEIDGEQISFLSDRFKIPLSECASHKDILAWVTHLLESKTGWVTIGHVEQFILTAALHHGLDLDLPH